jgi:hypothetical protein
LVSSCANKLFCLLHGRRASVGGQYLKLGSLQLRLLASSLKVRAARVATSDTTFSQSSNAGSSRMLTFADEVME